MLNLTRLKKIAAISTLFIFSTSAKAVIVEGTFNGLMWEWDNTNMHLTSDAEFFSDENAFRPFTGEFWYDTELASQSSSGVNEWGDAEVVYSGPHNWLHTNLKADNGAILDLTSSGSSPTYTTTPREEISFVRYEDHDLMSLVYADGELYDSRIHRVGSLALEPDVAFLNNLGLIQNTSSNGSQSTVNGYIYFENKGSLNGVDYFGWMVAEVTQFTINTRAPVSVPEPSPLLLFFGPMLFLFWRSGFLKNKLIQK